MAPELADRIFDSFSGASDSAPLPDLCPPLLAEQKIAWKELGEGYAGLQAVRVRELQCNGFSVKLQYNPKRIASTGANLEPGYIEKRPCFLCPQNLPATQKGILYRGEFFVLCNPAPIFNPHYTISNTGHLPQLFAAALPSFLQLAADFGERFTILYNGAACGASAPDHLHFQAVPAGSMPVEDDLCQTQKRHLVKQGNDAFLSGTRSTGRAAIIIEGKNRAGMEDLLKKAMAATKKILAAPGEPMVNIFCTYRDAGWRLFLFPRRKHRPDIYFAGEEEKILVSPGAAEMGGVVVTPREQDYRRLDAATIESIFNEVSPDQESLNRILDEIP
ncbi:MAG: DUF4922 domain-containing protein [Deltaproteobacteria bacterium]|nr:DUF4922 domain-containing protein [Deltaproteobacteria bacterium]